ncbi:MAG: selenide, water dikinase SelD [Alphaproteobacteria bacterium]
MDRAVIPVLKDLVLVGGGHAHAGVLMRFGMAPVPGLRLTLIARDTHTPYSGMLPGLVAGHYSFDDTHIDLRPLARFAGARFIGAEAIGLDPAAGRVICRDRPPVAYDLVSINVGSTPNTGDVPGACQHAIPVKPISTFLARWHSLERRILASERPLAISMVGGGAGSIEMVLAIQYALATALAARKRPDLMPRFRLVTDTATILPSYPATARRRIERILADAQIEIATSHAVTRVEDDRLCLADGRDMPSDATLWATAAAAPSWFRDSGLGVDARGFLALRETLQSVSHDAVFGAGDAAAVIDHPRPKAGVFAVRQGPPLAANLRRAVLGQSLKPFRPQRQFLSILATGPRYAVAARGRWSVEGGWVWRWKDHIDRGFMRRFSDLPVMEAAPPRQSAIPLADPEARALLADAAMRCGGCGAKVAQGVLGRALARLPEQAGAGVMVGLAAPDDAAVFSIPPGQALVQSVDYFRALVDDPYVFGQIAASHALGDIHAMGAEPHSALAIATLPFGLDVKTEDLLAELLAGAVAILARDGVALLGGHSGEGAELALGFAVNGLVDPHRILRKGGLRPGDALILTKAIGTGVLFAADQRRLARGRWIDAAIAAMLAPLAPAAQAVRTAGATAATDVTGFGLAGHVIEMLRASGTGAVISLGAIPALAGAIDMARAGVASSLATANARARHLIAADPALARDPRMALLFDPQTAGGLLAGIPPDRVASCILDLRQAGYADAAVIGWVEPPADPARPLRITA